MKRWRLLLTASLLLAFLAARPAFAAPWPGDGSEMIMADWLFFSFLTFFGAALVAFILAWRNGLLTDLEDAKYYILTIDEPDYYTPEWAREEEEGTGKAEVTAAERKNGHLLSHRLNAKRSQDE